MWTMLHCLPATFSTLPWTALGSLDTNGATSHIEPGLLGLKPLRFSSFPSKLQLTPPLVSWNTSIAALATVSNHWFSSLEPGENWVNISWRSSHDILSVHWSRFCKSDMCFMLCCSATRKSNHFNSLKHQPQTSAIFPHTYDTHNNQ